MILTKTEIFDFGETGLSGWTIYLDDNKNGNFDSYEKFNNHKRFGWLYF